MDIFIVNVLKNALQKYEQFAIQLSNGTLVLERFEELTKIQLNLNKSKQMNENWENHMRVLMKTSSNLFDERLIEQRMKQLKSVLRLSRVNEIVEVLVQIKTNNNITTPFEDLENIENSIQTETYKQKQLNEIDDKSMQIFKTLEDLSDDGFIKCLQNYNKNYEFVQWIRANTNGLYIN